MNDPFVVSMVVGVILALTVSLLYIRATGRKVKPAPLPPSTLPVSLGIGIGILAVSGAIGFNISFSAFKQHDDECAAIGGHKHRYYKELCVTSDGRIFE